LDGDVWKVRVDGGVRKGREGREVLGVGVVMRDGTEGHGEVLDDLKAEELEGCVSDDQVV
jgi:hypothetical protein